MGTSGWVANQSQAKHAKTRQNGFCYTKRFGILLRSHSLPRLAMNPNTPGSTSDQTIAILDRHLSGDFRAFPMAEGPCLLEQIEALGQRLGIRIPPDLTAHLSGSYPGLYLEAKEEIWPRPKKGDTGPFWSFLYALHTYSASPDSEDWMRMEPTAERFRSQTGLHAAPVLRIVGDADLYCLDPQGNLVRYDHEKGCLEAVNLTFFQVLEKEISALNERAKQKKRGES